MDRLQLTAQALSEHGFKAQVVETGQEAAALALELIGAGSVGFGGSITIDGLGIYDALKARGNQVYWHWKVAPEDRPAIFPKAHTADTYICSSNAILEGGALLNIDGTGNRVCGMLYGPKQVIIIAGQNKVCGDYTDGIARIKREACPPNARRLNLQTPCGATGVCTDCVSPQRMCNGTVLMERPCGAGRTFHVLLVREDLGC